MKTTALCLLLPAAAVATNPFVSLGLNEDFVRIDKHAHDAKMRRLASRHNPILPADGASAKVEMAAHKSHDGIVKTIAHAVEDCDPDVLFQREKSHHQDAKVL